MGVNERDWARVGLSVRERRLALGWTQAQAASTSGLSDSTWFVLEAGKEVSPRTLAKASVGLGWTPLSLNQVLSGGEVEPVSRPALVPSIRPASGALSPAEAIEADRHLSRSQKDVLLGVLREFLGGPPASALAVEGEVERPA